MSQPGTEQATSIWSQSMAEAVCLHRLPTYHRCEVSAAVRGSGIWSHSADIRFSHAGLLMARAAVEQVMLWKPGMASGMPHQCS